MLGLKRRILPENRTGYTYKGKEILLVRSIGQPYNGLKKLGMEKGVFPKEKEIEAATIFAVTGDIEQTCNLTGIQPIHFRKLIKTEGFQDLLKEIKDENSEKFGAKFTQIVNRAQDILLDRLENGDPKVLRDGTIVYIPVSMRDTAVVVSTNFDKLQLLQGKPTNRTETVSISNKLEALAERFIKITNKQLKSVREPEIIDAEVVVEVPV